MCNANTLVEHLVNSPASGGEVYKVLNKEAEDNFTSIGACTIMDSFPKRSMGTIRNHEGSSRTTYKLILKLVRLQLIERTVKLKMVLK